MSGVKIVNLIHLACEYVLSMSVTKKHNPQAIANVAYFNKYDISHFEKELGKSAEEFCKKNHHFKARDFVYKSDYFTPRNMFLISPLYYVYYTYTVFKIAELFLGSDNNLSFSKDRMKIFYSGFLSITSDTKEINRNSKFNRSYKKFQKEREKYFDYPVLKIDLQDFFNSIKSKSLINKLKQEYGKNKAIEDLQYFLEFCDFDCLPQFHYSIASSILSQMYLQKFDSKLEKIMNDENLSLIRFVDDMYFVYLDGKMDVKRNNDILNVISHLLWDEELVLNSSKTKFLSPEQYKYSVEVVSIDYDDAYKSFTSEKILAEKTKQIIEEGSLTELIKELCNLEKKDGIDLQKYKELINNYIAINGEDSRKIINNIIFSRKWEDMDKSELIQIVQNWRYIQFNPSQFTILYVLVCRYLEKENLIDGSRIKKVLNHLFGIGDFKFRDTLIAVAYLFQNKNKHNELLKKIEIINKDFVVFINKYMN